MSGDEISRKDFVAYFGTRQISMDAMENDADLRPLLRVTNADGTQRVRDEDGDGYISAAEAEGLFDAVDHFDSNGDLHSVDPSDPKVGRLTDAIAALSERSQGTRSISPGGRDERIELPPGHRRSPSVRSVISGKGSEIGPRTSGESVRLVQQRLADLSAFAGEASGHFDQATEAAVRDFQAENCLPETGVVDGPTAQALFPRVPECRPRNPSGEPLVPADYVSLADLQRELDVVFDRHGVTVTGSVRGRSRSNDVPYARIGQRELADAEAKVSDWWNGKADAKAEADPDYQPWTWDKSVDFFFEHNRAVRNRPALQNARTMAYTSGNQAQTSCWHTAGAMFDKVINKPVRREYINGKGKPTDTHESAQNMMSHVLGQATLTIFHGSDSADFVGDVHERDRPGLLDGDFESRREEMNAIDDYVDLYNNVHGQELGERLAAEMRLPPARGWTPELTAQYLNRVQDYFTETKGWQSEPLDPMDAHVMSFTSLLNEMQERRTR